MDGVVPLVFAHSYNSYATELPNDIFPNYMGRGWTHSFNCYIVASETGNPLYIRRLVHYPDGKIHSYKQNPNFTWTCESIGVFDTMVDGIGFIEITTPSKIVYRFESVVGQTNTAIKLIKSIKDRNNNTLTFTNELGINNAVRLKSVSDPTGRTMNFVYKTGEARNYLSEVNLSGVGAFNGRKIEFNYSSSAWDGDGIKDLTSYKENDKNGILKTTSYTYYTIEGSEHLLKTITLPKGNVIDNTYQQRKLKSSQTLNGATVVQQMNTNWTPTYNSTAATSTGAVTVTAGGTTKTTNYTHNNNGLAQTLKSTGTNPVDLAMTYGVSADPTSVSQITQTAAGVPTNVTIAYHMVAPYNVSSVTTVGPNGNITQSYTYNSFNDILSFTNGRGKTTTFGYNATGNLTSITHPLGQPTTMLRNPNGTISKVTTPAGVVTNFTYNTYGNLLTTSTPNGTSPAITTSATYDALSRVTSKTDARNQTVTYDYFANDLLKKMNAPLGYFVEYNYDANDNNTTVTNAKNNATTNVYHPQTDQLMSRSFGSKTESFTYYEDGSLKTFTNGRNQTFTFTYDPSGRITGDSYATYTYNPEGTLNTVTHTQGAKTYTLDYDYDVLRRLNKTTCDGFAVQYRYDNNNNLDLLTYPDGKTVAYAYDNKDRLTTVTDWAGRVTTYVYDDDGKILNYTLPNGSKAIYTYDAAGRPTGISHQKSSNAVICSSSFVLDQGGNHLEENIIEPYTSAPALTAGTTNYTTNARNETTAAGSNAYTFDGNGATTNQAGQALTWDTKDNLLTRNGITYFYDGNETRRAKTGKRFVINELSNSVIAETNDAGAYLYFYVYGPTGLLYRQSASGAVEYYHYDFRGSTIATTDASQNIVRQYQYDAYGKILQQTPTTDDNPFRYVGQHGVQYEAPDLYFMRARYYDPTTGKFLSEDPIWSTNLFAYGDNNPSMRIDPSGLKAYEGSTLTVVSVDGAVAEGQTKGGGTNIKVLNGESVISIDSKGLAIDAGGSVLSAEKQVYQDNNTTVSVRGGLLNAKANASSEGIDLYASFAQGSVTVCQTWEKANVDVEATVQADLAKVSLTGFKPVAIGGDLKITPGANTACQNHQYNYGKGNSCNTINGYKPNGQTIFKNEPLPPPPPSYGPGNNQIMK
jgi:RHS repeat-associated protein